MTRLAYPAVLGSALLAVFRLMESGMDPALALFVVAVGAGAVVIALERTLPFVPRWNRNHGDFRTDLCHGAVSNLLLTPLLKATILALLVWTGTSLQGLTGFTWWPVEASLGLQTALGLVLGELLFVRLHQWLHQRDLGWRFHAIHHSSERLYWLNGLRVHPLQAAFSMLCFQAPLAILGAGVPVMATVATFHAVHGLLQHSNIDLRLGWLNWIVSGPELHRIHHSPDLATASHNFGNNLIVWDVIFGTRLLPLDHDATLVGIAGMPGFPTGFGAQLMLPFRWRAAQQELEAPPGASPAVAWNPSFDSVRLPEPTAQESLR